MNVETLYTEILTPGVEIDNAFDASTAIALTVPGELRGTAPMVYKKATFKAMTIFVSEITTASSLSIQICFDPDGDSPVTPTGSATIVLGITTNSVGSITLSGGDLSNAYPYPFGNLYLFVKTNAGTCRVDTVTHSWYAA